ncbi:NAD(P)-dependent oxidoreductase [Salsipaludibacter albus]|uniref:NAD(P)-dependent oxidoreductase n=1 Tax=Salsipaludibacter albus TaxID=2849650 RepID=UPI001EE49484|nr:NAD(P)-dependent oxidoreductase [Salsipaludibacter albus]MBY5162423.1 NAD(P)-dependent oxidoreductase [Salsipaludibacter albus]
MTTVGFIGLGAMGRPMAANLAAEHEVYVHNRTASVATEHAAAHGTTAVDLAGLAPVEVVITCLPTTAEVLEVADELVDHLADGTRWVDCTSGDPAASVALADRLAEDGITYLDAPVSGGTDGARQGTLTMMVGGPAEVIEELDHVLDRLAERIVHVGDVGAGHAVKAVNNTLLAANLWAVGEGLVTLARSGVDVGRALQVVNHSSGRSFASEVLVPQRVLTREFPATFGLGLLAKDTRLGRDLVSASGARAPVLRLVTELFQVAADELGDDVDHTAALRLIERWADTELS